MKKKKYHIFGFEHPEFYVHIKAYSLEDAIHRFITYFGSLALNNVESIYNPIKVK